MRKEIFESVNFANPLRGNDIFVKISYTNFAYPKHFHDEFLIQSISKGTNKFCCCGRQHSAMPGDIVLMNPGEVHDGCGCGNEKLEYHVLFFQPTTWNRILDKDARMMEGHQLSFSKTVVKDPVLFRSIGHYFTLLEQPDADSFIIEESYFRLLSYVAEKHLHARPRIHSFPYGYTCELERARTYIEDNLGERLSLNELSAQSSFSTFHFLRLFTQHTGLTLHQYIMVRRLERAKQMLKAGKSIGEATQSLGFSDQSHFIRSFRRMVGVTPGQFRANFRN